MDIIHNYNMNSAKGRGAQSHNIIYNNLFIKELFMRGCMLVIRVQKMNKVKLKKKRKGSTDKCILGTKKKKEKLIYVHFLDFIVIKFDSMYSLLHRYFSNYINW